MQWNKINKFPTFPKIFFHINLFLTNMNTKKKKNGQAVSGQPVITISITALCFYIQLYIYILYYKDPTCSPLYDIDVRLFQIFCSTLYLLSLWSIIWRGNVRRSTVFNNCVLCLLHESSISPGKTLSSLLQLSSCKWFSTISFKIMDFRCFLITARQLKRKFVFDFHVLQLKNNNFIKHD